MPPPSTYEICTCKKCACATWKSPSGQNIRGALQPTAVKQKHMRAEGKRKPSNSLGSEDQQAIGDTILLSTMAPILSSPGEHAPSRLHLNNELRASGSRRSEASTPSRKRQRTDIGPSQEPPIVMDSAMATGPPDRLPYGSDVDVKEDSAEQSRVLSRLQETLAVKRKQLSVLGSIRFQTLPTSLQDNPADLDLSHDDSLKFYAFLKWLENSLALVREMEPVIEPGVLEHKRTVEDHILEEIKRLEAFKVSRWDQEKALSGLYIDRDPSTTDTEPLEVDTRPFFTVSLSQPWVLAVLVVTTALHTLSAVSRDQCSLILTLVQVLIHGVLTSPEAQAIFPAPLRPPSSRPQAEAARRSLHKALPLDVRTAAQRLGVEPDFNIFACCPKCFATYASVEGVYPTTCTHRDTPADAPCGEQLLRQGGEEKKGWVPLKPYPVHSLRAWLGRLLSRSGIEDLLDRSWDLPPGCEGVWRDIMHAPGIREFKGPDGTSLFSAQPNGRYHLVFSLFVDWFNPFGNKASGKSHSIGAIYMVCLNLPPELRYRTENMFLVGVIPGPREPRKEQLNHLLRPLIDELLLLWTRGVHFSKTANRSYGCDIFVAVIPLVCDLPAARKTAGFSGHSAEHFCSFCDLPRSQLNNLDRSTWRRKTWEEHTRVAKEWRDAPNRRVREQIFAEHGIRWSELLRLPYWDPTRYTIVDAMHNLYLGELAHHCREVLGIEDGEELSEKQKEALHSPDQQAEELSKVAEALHTDSKSSLMKVRKGYVRAFAQSNGVATARDVKEDYAVALLNWYRSKAPEVLLKVPPALNWPTADFRLLEDAEDMLSHNFIDRSLRSEIREIIKKMTFPSWMNRPPHNFGSKSHGNLKADQWRTAATICMPIALIKKWGSPSASKGEHGMLTNFMHMVIAVEAATSKTMSYDQARFYDTHMYQYLTSLRLLFDHDLVPNHHMALHLRECLELFGPVQAWWTFPFERYNGILAKLNKNNKPAEMPTTFLRYFCMGANLRSLMSGISWPENEYYLAFKESFNEVIGDALRGLPGIFSQVDSGFSYDSSKAAQLPSEVYAALLLKLNTTPEMLYTSAYTSNATGNSILSPYAQPVRKVSKGGIDFLPCTERGNRSSYIICQRNLPGMEGVEKYPAQIQQIFYHVRNESNNPKTEAFLVVKKYSALSEDHAAFDLFRRWPGHPTMTYYNRFEDGLSVLREDEIVSHFSGYVYMPDGIGQECILIHSLERVGGFRLNMLELRLKKEHSNRCYNVETEEVRKEPSRVGS